MDLTTLGIEDLMNLTVTSVSRKEQNLSSSAAAIFVITQEDIRRSGVTSIPEALRMVPGLEVARIDANKWAVTSRGFNGRFARKLLVLMDGRTVYSQMFSGVFWDAQDTILEDVERIEVIRGPGATMWGANSVNGIINIITKHSVDTTGGLVTAGGGTQERLFGTARYGTTLGSSTNLRTYVKYLERRGMDDTQTGKEGHNGWHAVRCGFRLDAESSDTDSLTLQGDYYDEKLKETYVNTPPTNSSFDYTTPVSGGNLLARWKRSFSDTSDMALQLYYDRTEMNYAVLNEKRDTLDIDFQNRFALAENQEIVWGAGYRFTHDHLQFPSQILTLSPQNQDNNVFSAFVQGNFTLLPDRLHLIIGSKFEHNDYTGFEIQPNARMLWIPANKQSLWISVSRAVRTPSRAEDSLSFEMTGPPVSVPFFPQPLPSRIHLTGNTDLKSEELMAYELGYRVEPTEQISFDAATFYNVYSQLDGQKQGTPIPDFSNPAQPYITIPMQLTTGDRAETWGVELATNLKALPWWRIRMAYTYFQVTDEENDLGTNTRNENPHHQVSFRSMMNVSKNIDFDLWLRYVDKLSNFNISSYVTLDARLAWRPINNLELTLVGQNLLHDRQQEFIPQFISTQPATVGRSMYGKVTWQF
jgi:iron complex outermembrane receptor protein